MKRALTILALLTISVAAEAQMQIRTTPATFGATDREGFRLGPRYSNYSTDADIGIVTVRSGRQHAFGLVGEFRSGAFVLDFNVDHDPENGIQLIDLLPIEVSQYERDRAEVTVGWAPLTVLDIQAGFRIDSFTIGGAAFGGGPFAADEIEHGGLVVGVNVHTPTRSPFGVYGIFRGFVGSAEFGDPGLSQDSSGWRAEGGVEIPVGQSRWHVVPGIELERLRADPLRVDTNRFFVNVVYSFR